VTDNQNASASEGTKASRQAATLEFREATKRYPGQDSPAVDKLSLEVPAGEICVFVGPSGCGKTTAMRMVNRMIDITDGDILLDGSSVRDRKPAELRREIGYAIQQIGLFPHLSIADNIATVPKLLGWDKKRIAARVDELLELVSLDPHETRNRYPAQLSGGQRQRVGVARALAVDPPLMLMDEPFGAIDPINRERLQNEFLRLQQDIRKTIVFVTHDIDEAIKMGDKIAVLQKGGKLAQFASPAELLMYPASKFVEDFVGADRALKRLALQRVRDIDLWKVAQVRVGQSTSEARALIADADVKSHVLVVDDRDRPLGWLSESAMRGDRIREDDVRRGAIVEMDDILRDALADVLTAEARYGTVVDGQGAVKGVLSIEVISHFLADASADQARSGADLVEDEPDLVEEEA
jgi:osmoprotectant transport system ATP-binding protein